MPPLKIDMINMIDKMIIESCANPDFHPWWSAEPMKSPQNMWDVKNRLTFFYLLKARVCLRWAMALQRISNILSSIALKSSQKVCFLRVPLLPDP
jgi:hypothetical protein